MRNDVASVWMRRRFIFFLPPPLAGARFAIIDHVDLLYGRITTQTNQGIMKRKTLYSVLEGDANSRPTVIYDRFMTFVILLSLLPLCFKESNLVLDIIDYVTVSIFMIDYALRWSTADMKLGHGRLSFLIYPFTPMALIDMLSILPSFLAINPSWRLSRLVRLIRVVRAFKLLRYSRSLKMIVKVFIDEREPLLAVLLLAIAYTFVSALIVFNVEPETFPSLFDAVY